MYVEISRDRKSIILRQQKNRMKQLKDFKQIFACILPICIHIVTYIAITLHYKYYNLYKYCTSFDRSHSSIINYISFSLTCFFLLRRKH